MEASICEQCGGAKITQIPKLKTSRGMPVTPAIPPELKTAKVCLCHPEPAPKHDGWLNEQKDYNVDYGESWDKGMVLLTDFSDHYGETHYLWMPAQAALSLLAWLKQEEANLRKLAEKEKQS